MRLSYLLSRVVFFTVLLLGSTAFSVIAQPWQHASAVASSRNAYDEELAVDGSDATAARLTTPLLAGTARLRVAFPTAVRRGGRAGLIIQLGSTVDLGVLGNTTIYTYMNGSNTPVDNFSVNSLLNLSLAGTNKVAVEFPVNADFNQVELRTTGLLNASVNIDIFDAYGTITPLPVELTTFLGKATSTGVALTWNTASERNNDRFVVERADEQPEAFRAIGQVKGVGNSSQPRQYQFLDKAPKAVSYYRLRQVDADGREEFSPIVMVKSTAAPAIFAAYPSPATDFITVAGAEGAAVGLFNQFGHRLQDLEAAPAPTQRPQLDVRHLPAGIYFLRNAATGQSTRFVKDASGR